MIRTFLAAMTALSVMAGIAVAQTPVPTTAVDTSRQRTIDLNGVVTEQTNTVSRGAAVTPYGVTTTTDKETESHTVR
jgi:hypothetical protein